ncbi:MAG: GDP-L-fucose synthase [Thermoflavifilum sp.]|nr:GDP-L-fucose synthase [Thermoflavifilum sp.]
MHPTDKIYVAGHRGMVGSAILKRLQELGYSHFVLRTSEELDLRNQAQVFSFFQQEKPDYVFLAAARVGGILANNTFRAEFIYDNLQIEANVIHAAYLSGVKKLMFLGSSCIYPRLAPQPIKESYLLTGPLEPTNEPYAIAKIAGIKLCEAYRAQYGCHFISVMPTNLYGIHDNFDLATSHVLPALLRKFHEAKLNHAPEVVVWGTGKPRREFLYVDDLADACVYLMNLEEEPDLVNIGTGEDLSIAELATLIQKIVGYTGKVVYDTSKPDGTPRKLLDVSLLHSLGWRHKTPLEEGIRKVYEAVFLSQAGQTDHKKRAV